MRPDRTTSPKRWTKTFINNLLRFLGVRTLFAKRVCVFLTPFNITEVVFHFFFDTRSAKKKISKRNAVTRALRPSWRESPTREPHHLLKKVDENFNKKFFSKVFGGADPFCKKGLRNPQSSSSSLRTAMNASGDTCTEPSWRIFFLPSFCFSSSFFFRVISPP